VVKGGIGATLGILGSPTPFMYTHLVYWTVQILLVIISIETGINLVVMYGRKGNGDEMYTFDDANMHYPERPKVWYGNYFLTSTVRM